MKNIEMKHTEVIYKGQEGDIGRQKGYIKQKREGV